jgi:hypothetical protein
MQLPKYLLIIIPAMRGPVVEITLRTVKYLLFNVENNSLLVIWGFIASAAGQYNASILPKRMNLIWKGLSVRKLFGVIAHRRYHPTKVLFPK